MDFSRQILFGTYPFPGLKLQTFAYFVYLESCAVSRRLGRWYQ